MGFLNTDSMPKLVEALADANNIKITGNAKGTKVGTVVNKIVEKADEVTKAVEQEVSNTTHSFKVGAGNVDVSSDAQDGFGEVGIKGMTYQNLLGKHFIGSDSNDYISIESEKIKFNKPQTGSNISIRYPNTLVQPSKTYTLMFYVYKNTLQREGVGDSYNVAKFNIVSYNTGFYYIPKNTTGLVKVVLHQPSTVAGDGKPYLEVYGSCFGELEISYPILLEGDYTNDNDLPLCLEGIVGVGDKSKNLFNEVLVNNNSYKDTGISENGSYNISFDIETTKRLGLEAMQGSNQLFNVAIESGKISKNVTLSNGESLKLRLYRWDSGAELISMSNMMIEKGVIATEFEDSYDGYKIEILSSGKNIFDKSTITDNSYIDANGDVISYNGWFSSDFIRVHKGEKYYIYNEKHREPFAGLYSYYYDVNKNKIERLNLGDVELVGIKEFVSKYDGYIRISGITRHIEKGKFYANSDKTQILLDEPLMRLPNGVCDEITRDGKLIRRVGKVLLDGSQHFNQQRVFDDRIVFGSQIDNILVDKSGGILPMADNFPCAKQSDVWNGIVEGLGYSDIASGIIRVSINKSRLSPENRDGLKNFFTTNPTTLYYQLNTPTITNITPATLRIFKNGHITFNTLVAPESTHLVQLNKSAQIERSIREVQGLDARVERLEGFYDDMILETAHKLFTLDFDFSLMRKGE